jgi:hypothetical protein
VTTTADPAERTALVHPRRHRLLALAPEILFVLVGYWLYSLVADAAPRIASTAIRHAEDLRHVEADLHIGIEHAVNSWWVGWRTTIMAGNLYYDLMHFAVPVGVLVFLFLRRPALYPRYRTALLVASLLGLVVFWVWPVAPPRLLPHAGFVDTVATVRTLGSGGSHGMTSAENPFAAMPSLHVCWALWAAVGVFALTRRRWVRGLAVAHPLITTFVIVATGNHLLADAFGGMAVLALGFATAVAWDARPRRRTRVRP